LQDWPSRLALMPAVASPALSPRRARDAFASRGASSRRARWWLWGVLPYFWLALFSEALHTHSPLDFAAASTYSQATSAQGAAEPSGAQPSRAARAGEAADCLACQWLACSVALLGAAVLVALGKARLARAARTLLPVAARARRACSRGPPASLMFSV